MLVSSSHMKLKTKVGQILLTNPRDQNFTSLYEEAFSKHGQNVELFVTLEIADAAANLSKPRRLEYEQLAQMLVSAFKKTYIAAAHIDQNTFEQALTAINAALSRLAAKGKVSWYGKFHAAIAAVCQNQLSISITGNALVYLLRKNELSTLSDDLVEGDAKAVKIFSNYSSGRVTSGDRVILSTNKLINYLSLDRMRKFLSEEDLADTCQEIISVLKDVKTIGFATFIFEISSGIAEKEPVNIEREINLSLGAAENQSNRAVRRQEGWVGVLMTIGSYAWSGLQTIAGVIANLLGALFALVVNFFKRRPKKYLFAAIAIVLAILLINVFIAWRKSANKNQPQKTTVVSQIDKDLNDAEAALIYKDNNQVTTLLNDAQKLLADNPRSGTSAERQSFAARVTALKNKINNEIHIDNPKVLTQFSNIPTELLHSPNGFLGFNRNTKTFSFYDFRTGATNSILPNSTSTSVNNLSLGTYVGGPHEYVFLDTDGNLDSVKVATQQISRYAGQIAVVSPTNSHIQDLQTLGDGNTARVYLLDTKQNQIWRSKASDKGFAPAEAWLKDQGINFAGIRDFEIDGSVYLLFPDRVDKYFNGQKQSFGLSVTSPALKNATRIFATADTKSIYILDPDNQRIVVFDKNGKFQEQILSSKFHDLSDLYVDESQKQKLMYVLTGSELLQFNF
jgi:energy-coupling factor transporter transmembrane protein EcfT